MAWPNGTRLKTFAAGGSFVPTDGNNIEDRMLQIAGYRGKSIIATEQARSNTAYGLLTTPDQVSNIVLPTDGLLCIAYQALWKQSVDGAARAAIFLDSNQAKIALGNTGPVTQAAANGAGIGANLYTALASFGGGLFGLQGEAATQVTTGQILGGVGSASGVRGFAEFNGATARAIDLSESGVTYGVHGGAVAMFAAAGTYDISVQFKASSGSVTAKERKLWVWTMPFE